ncbi:MAG: hypothetical protein EA381_07585 [Planctomycetaceae bacterium]|nr:MAG: hypothetical protein EA381_07585 [Planctomycetaceae bacterium]
MEIEPPDTHARDALARTLKRFSLTYEQHQLLHGDGIGLLATQLVVKRTRFTLFLALLAATFAILVARGMISAGPYTLWAICFAICVFWLWRRHVKTTALRIALVAYVAENGEKGSIPGTLADDLRIGFNLQYDEHQSLRSGDAVLAADRIIRRCKANSRKAVRGGVFLSLFGLLWIVSSLFSGPSVLWGVSVWASLSLLAMICVIAITVNDRATIARVEKLLRDHESDADLLARRRR